VPVNVSQYRDREALIDKRCAKLRFPVAMDSATDAAPMGVTRAALGANLRDNLVLIDKRGNLRYLLLCDDPALTERISQLLQEPFSASTGD